MSILPRKWAPSAIATRGALLNLDLLGPGDVTAMTTQHDHRLGQNLRTDIHARSNREQILAEVDGALTCPSMTKFSLPVSPPFITTDRPMLAAEVGPLASGGGAPGWRGPESTGTVGASVGSGSCRFHILSSPLVC